MGYRKQRFAALFCAAAVIMVGGCGDDLTQQVYIPGREDLAQPIGGYNATTQAGQTAEDSATGGTDRDGFRWRERNNIGIVP